MRWPLRLLVLGLVAAGCCMPVMAQGLKGFKGPDTETCGEYGTSVHFEKTPKEAAKKALKEEKLVFVLHISGVFEESALTWNNAEALRVNALADPKVGKYLDTYFVSSFQKVGTFRIVGKQKQGGNVASYFCAPDGRVLHAVAGPVDAPTLLREAQWVIETAKKGIELSKGDGGKFKAHMRVAHAEKLRHEHGLAVEPVTFDPPEAQDPNDALTYRDPTGRPLAPVLKPAPIDGPDVKFNAQQFNALQEKGKSAPGAANVLDRQNRGWVLGTQGRVHVLMAAHSMSKIDRLYASIFEGILGERISTQPVQIVNPFPWHRGKQVEAN